MVFSVRFQVVDNGVDGVVAKVATLWGELRGKSSSLGMVSGCMTSTPSGKKTDHIFVIPHLKNRRYTNLG